ncbi:hypothetical protein DFJ74DRAFT_677279 [Hyaloraphidium curvatum]|nr:hypothetical protein DFJ74DRAFT_677279 [Hyaloraphidium curvatum]
MKQPPRRRGTRAGCLLARANDAMKELDFELYSLKVLKFDIHTTIAGTESDERTRAVVAETFAFARGPVPPTVSLCYCRNDLSLGPRLVSLPAFRARRRVPCSRRQARHGVPSFRQRHRQGALPPWELHRRSHALQIGKVFNAYEAAGEPCSGKFLGAMDIFFYYSRLHDAKVDLLHQKLERSATFRKVRRCFSERGTLFANLSDVEDGYPAGPSNMFFKLMESSDLYAFRSNYRYMFWAEPDVRPIRPFWADSLYIEATLPSAHSLESPDYWMKGSMYRGRGLDRDVIRPRNWNWVDHLNGNAIYRLNDPEFEDFLRITKEHEPPSDYWKPFDISISRALNSNPYGWVLRQYAARKFVQTDFIQHFGYFSEMSASAAMRNPRTVFMHGKRDSAGAEAHRTKFDVAGQVSLREVSDAEKAGGVRREHKICIVLYVPAGFLDYAALAVNSALRHSPEFHALVVIVPRGAFEDALKMFPGADNQRIRLVADSDTSGDGKTNQSLIALRLDEYCPNDTLHVLHLDFDSVITRRLLTRDVFFRRKPIAMYAPYGSTGGQLRTQQDILSALIKQNVTLDFSSSIIAPVFPVQSYNLFRSFLEKTHGKSFVDLVISIQHKLGSAFFMTVLIAAFLYHYEPALVTFVPHYEGNPSAVVKFADVFPIIAPYVCQGHVRLASDGRTQPGPFHREKLAALKRATYAGWDSGCREAAALGAQ